jgi:hypothetical protein
MYISTVFTKITLITSLHFFAALSTLSVSNCCDRFGSSADLFIVSASDQNANIVSSTSKKKNRYNVNTIEELKSTDASKGAIITTNGYYEADDNGGAKYSVSADPKYPLETNLTFALNNGLYANLSTDRKSVVNIETFGITDGYIAGALNSVLPYLSGNIDGIRFPDGNYYVEDAVVLKSINFYGSNNSTIIVDSKYASNSFAVFRTDSDVSNSVSFHNIHMVANIDNNISRKRTITLLYLRNIDGCTISDCTFQANESADINPFIAVNLVWFQTDIASNVTVKRSTFKNNTGLDYQPGTDIKLHGGCLWFSGETLDAHMSKLSISNCVFDSTVADEHVGIWNGHFSDVNLSQCSFSNNSRHISDNFLTFCAASYNSINISDIDMTINSSTMYPIKFTNFLEQSDFTIDNCNITFNFDKKSNPSTHSFSVVYVDEDQLVDSDIPVDIIFRNSSFRSSSDNVSYRSVIQCQNTTKKTFHIIDCDTNIQCVRNLINASPNNNVYLECSPSFQ